MTISVRVQQDKLKAAMQKMVSKMPGIADRLTRKVAFDVVAEVAELVPVDTGRYRAGWRVSLDVLAAGEGAEGETVSVFSDGASYGVQVTNPVEYGPAIEYGTARTPPGNHLAIALESVRKELAQEELAAEVSAAWQEST